MEASMVTDTDRQTDTQTHTHRMTNVTLTYVPRRVRNTVHNEALSCKILGIHMPSCVM